MVLLNFLVVVGIFTLFLVGSLVLKLSVGAFRIVEHYEFINSRPEFALRTILSPIEFLSLKNAEEGLHYKVVIDTFPDGNSTLIPVYARFRYVASTQWGNKKYMDMKHLETRFRKLLLRL